MPELVLVLVATALTLGELKFQVTEGLCCWVTPFSSLGDDWGRGT